MPLLLCAGLDVCPAGALFLPANYKVSVIPRKGNHTCAILASTAGSISDGSGPEGAVAGLPRAALRLPSARFCAVFEVGFKLADFAESVVGIDRLSFRKSSALMLDSQSVVAVILLLMHFDRGGIPHFDIDRIC